MTDRPEQNPVIEEERRAWSRRRRDLQLLKHELEFRVVRLACEPLFQHIGVDAHGGTVRAESEEGKGSTFHLTLPFNPARS